MKQVGLFILAMCVLFLYAFLSDRGKANDWRKQHTGAAEAVGLTAADLVAPDLDDNAKYTFLDEEDNSFPRNPNQSKFPPKGVLFCARGGDLTLAWSLNKNVFWSGNPNVTVVSPSSDEVRIVRNSGPPPDQVAMNRVNEPSVTLRIESSDPKAHICELAVSGLDVAIAEFDSGDAFHYRERDIPDSEIRVLIEGKR